MMAHVSDAEINTLCNRFGFTRHIGVLTGWEWAIRNQDLEPVYQMELANGTSRQKFNCKDHKTALEVMRIYRR